MTDCMTHMKCWMTGLLLCLSCQMMGQDGMRGFVRKLGALIDTMSVSGLDRRYIDAPAEPWQIIARGNVNQGVMSMTTESELAGVTYRAKPYLKTKPAKSLGLWAGYRGYGVGYMVNVGGDRGQYLTFGAMGGAYGVNVRIHSFDSNTPNFSMHDEFQSETEAEQWEQVELRSPIKVRTVIADAYYLLNGKRFSYAAAYDQSVIQKRSAGSLMVGGMYNYARIDYASPLNGDLIYLMEGLGRVQLWQGSVGVGYAYNWVPCRGLLVNVMFMPMLTFVNRIRAFGYSTNVEELMMDPIMWDESKTVQEQEEWFYGHLQIESMGRKSFNSGLTVNFDARVSLTYNFGRFFVNAYGQFNNSRYWHGNSHGHLNEWFVNTSFGVRL